jgi:hypothetical protein
MHSLKRAMRFTMLTSLLLAYFLIACEAQSFTPQEFAGGEEGEGGIQEKEKTYHVDLPPLINLTEKTPPIKNADGTFRVDGLKFFTNKYLDEEITITAYLIDRYKEPKEGTTKQPDHLWIGDELNCAEEKRMRVVGIDPKIYLKLKVGQPYKFTGKLVQKSPQGFISTDGILVYTSAELIK